MQVSIIKKKYYHVSRDISRHFHIQNGGATSQWRS